MIREVILNLQLIWDIPKLHLNCVSNIIKKAAKMPTLLPYHTNFRKIMFLFLCANPSDESIFKIRL